MIHDPLGPARQLNDFLRTAKVAAEFGAALIVFRKHREFLRLNQQLYAFQQIGMAAGRVCDVKAPTESRLSAAKYLITLWNPYPFDPKVKAALRAAGPSRRAELWQDLPLRLICAAGESAELAKPRRIGRKWIKEETGKRTKLTLIDLRIADFLRALRTLNIRAYEQLIIDAGPLLLSRSVRDSDTSFTDSGPSDGGAALLDRLAERLPTLTARERQLVDLLAQGMSKANAARYMKIAPSTARVAFHRLKLKLHRAL